MRCEICAVSQKTAAFDTVALHKIDVIFVMYTLELLYSGVVPTIEQVRKSLGVN